MSKLSIPNFDIKKNIGYIVIGLVMAAILLIDVFLIMRPQLKALSAAGQKAAEISKNIKKTRDNVKNIASLEREEAQLSEKLKAVKEDLLAHQETVMVLETISKAAAKCNIRITQVTPLKENSSELSGTSGGEFLFVPVLVNGEGAYHDIGLFFNILENDDVLADIQSFQVAENPQSPKKHLLTMTLVSFLPKKILE